ncbi:MAG: tRNA (N(6)-L-threonylcarbamoyladenosine(37)-C(2))-methylthiotransferase MtaB [Candidatus Margulisbacteria bacterium]|nr:tRNA (N(6)-L-threonylcarbamoyladenosine(37)-C(2))-methylthiotransferase MtaB [Candidatus Margulisiibacteriota bacterium]
MKFHIITLGCKVNQAESEQAGELLAAYGHEYITLNDKPDLVIVNTCSVTHIADRKSRQMISRALSQNPQANIIITGCSIENEGAKLPAIKNSQVVLKNNLLEVIKEYNPKKINIEGHAFQTNINKTRKMVMVQNGCNYFCSYCVVPYVRSRIYSIPAEKVLDDIRQLVNKGVKEIVLTGINLGTYSSTMDLYGLVQNILQLEGDFRLRLSSLEPNLISDKIVSLVQENSRIAPHLHIPMQGTTNKILKAMERKYTLEQYLKLVERIRSKNITLTTDLIIGFPGESDKDFEQTVKIIEKGIFMDIHLFMYSLRNGTKAAGFKNHVPYATKKARMDVALKKVREGKKKFLRNFINKNVTVLIEQEKNGWYYGFSEHYFKVKIKKQKNNLVNEFVNVNVKDIIDDGRQIVAIAEQI